MKIYKLKHVLGTPSVYATPRNDFFVRDVLELIPSIPADTQMPALQLADAAMKGRPFYLINNSILVFSKEVYMSPLGSILSYSGDVFETILNDTGEELFLLNVTAMYNCIDHASTVYNAPPPLKQDLGKDHQMGIKIPAFFPSLVGDSSLFRIPQHKRSAVYVASRGNESSDDFYYMYQQSGMKGLEFVEVWDGD